MLIKILNIINIINVIVALMIVSHGDYQTRLAEIICKVLLVIIGIMLLEYSFLGM